MKKHLLGIFAVVLGLAFSAFTVIPNNPSSLESNQWFVLEEGGDAQNPLDYSPTGAQPCEGDGAVCGVFAQEDPQNQGHPILNSSAIYARKP